MSKRLIPIISLSIILILVIATVVMALVNVSYKPNFKTSNSVCIAQSGTSSLIDLSLDNKKEERTKLLKLLNRSFEESAISSFFNGRISYKNEVKYSSSTISKSSIGNCIIISFGEEQTAFCEDENDTIKYYRVIFDLTSNNLEEVKIYLQNEDSSSLLRYYFVAYADYSVIGNYVKDLLRIYG